MTRWHEMNHVRIIIDVYEDHDNGTQTAQFFINGGESTIVYKGTECNYSVSRGHETKDGDIVTDGKIYLDVTFKGIHEDSK